MEHLKNNSSVAFGDLIGGTMQAIIEGEALAAKTSAEFIEEFGFESGPDGPQLRTLVFSYRASDNTIHKVSMPVLSLLKPPSIQVKEAEIDFSLRIDDILQTSQKEQAKPSYQMRTSIARKSNTRSRVNMDVKLRLEQPDLSDGQIRFMNLLYNGISTESTTP